MKLARGKGLMFPVQQIFFNTLIPIRFFREWQKEFCSKKGRPPWRKNPGYASGRILNESFCIKYWFSTRGGKNIDVILTETLLIGFNVSLNPFIILQRYKTISFQYSFTSTTLEFSSYIQIRWSTRQQITISELQSSLYR